jgi:hypothetical protein
MARLSSHIKQSGGTWSEDLRKHILNDSEAGGAVGLLEKLGAELKSALEKRRNYLARPVTVPASVLQDDELVLAVANLSEGKKAFGTFGFFGKSEQKKHIEAIIVVGHPPGHPGDWRHVLGFIRLQQDLRQLALRWNALAGELRIPLVQGTSPDSGLTAAKLYEIVEAVKAHVELEARLRRSARELVPCCQLASDSEVSEASLKDLERALQHHLAKHRLGHVWSVKQSMLQKLEAKVEAFQSAFGALLRTPLEIRQRTIPTCKGVGPT